MGIMNKIVSRATGTAPQHDPRPVRPEQPLVVDCLVHPTGSSQPSASWPAPTSVEPSSPRLRTEIAFLKAQLQQCQGELALAQASAIRYQGQFTQSAADAASAKKDPRALQVKHTTASKDIEAFAEELSGLKMQSEAWEEKFSVLQAESAGLKGEVESLQGEVYIAKQALTLRDAHETKVRWRLAEDGCTGQICANLFDSIGESAPAALYAGRYQAPVDEAGRIFVDCDPTV